jgi:hypothetical protein
MAEDYRAIALHVLVVEDAVRSPFEQAQQSRFSRKQWLSLQILSVEFQQVERK